MKRGWLLTALCLGTGISYSAFDRMPYGADLAGLAGAGSARTMIWGILGNPAATAGTPDPTLSLFYSPQPFGLRELERSAFVFGFPVPPGCFAVAMSGFGFELYREVTVSLSYSRRFGDRFDAGIAATYFRLSIGSYGVASAVGVDVGMQWTIGPGVRGGFTATNINAPSIGSVRERLPQTFSGGIAYEPWQDVVLQLDLFKDLHFPLETRFGVECRPVDQLTVRGGVARDPSTFSAGLGIAVHPVTIDYAFYRHGELGFVHHVGVTMSFAGW